MPTSLSASPCTGTTQARPPCRQPGRRRYLGNLIQESTIDANDTGGSGLKEIRKIYTGAGRQERFMTGHAGIHSRQFHTADWSLAAGTWTVLKEVNYSKGKRWG